MKKVFYAMMAAAFLASCSGNKTADGPAMTMVVNNPLALQRTDELVTIDHNSVVKGLKLENNASFVILDETGKQVPYQISSDRMDIVTTATVGPNATATYTIKPGTPEEFEPCVFGKRYPERVDDIAWENEYSAYRLYGPALQASGERAYGYDVWTKSVNTLVVDQRYKLELGENKAKVEALRAAGKKDEADAFYKTISYHVDHGNGLDCYKVGPTLGGGTAALYVDGKIIYPKCYVKARILEQGPIRFRVELEYEPTDIKGQKVVEHRIIEAYKGSRLNKCMVFYAGLNQEVEVVTGLVIHPENKDTLATSVDGKYIAYADLTDNVNNNNGVIYVGAVCPSLTDARAELFSERESKRERGGATGHVLAVSPQKPNVPYIYYFGSSWSKFDMPNMEAWEQYLDEYAQKLRRPLKVSLQ